MLKMNFVKSGKLTKFYEQIKQISFVEPKDIVQDVESFEGDELITNFQVKSIIIHGSIKKDLKDDEISYFNYFKNSNTYPNSLPIDSYVMKLEAKKDIIDLYKNSIYFPPYNFILENDDFSQLYTGAFINSKVLDYYLNRFDAFKENYFSNNIAQLIDLIKEEFENGYYEGVIDNFVLLIEYEIKAKYGLNRIYNDTQNILTSKIIKRILSNVFFNIGATDLYFKYIENMYFPDDINSSEDLNTFTDAINLLFIYDTISTVLGKINFEIF